MEPFIAHMVGSISGLPSPASDRLYAAVDARAGSGSTRELSTPTGAAPESSR